MRTPIPIRVPPSWFLTTSADYSSSTSRPYCRSLPILGFTSFPSVAKQNFPWCACCPSKLSLRRQLRIPKRIPVSVGPRHRGGRFRPSRSPRTLPSHLFSSVVVRGGFPSHRSTGSRGLRALLHRRVRCSLDRFQSRALGAPLGLSDSSAPLTPCELSSASGEELQRGRACGPIGVTSKTIPKNDFSA